MHVYCSGIGGVGIGPLGLLALDAGYQVSGSDLHESEMTALLKMRGADVQIGQDGTQIFGAHTKIPIDWFVYSSALPTDHPELLFAKEHNIKTSKRDEFLNTLLDEHGLDLIAVAGTHGKTTTTGMLIWLFKQLGIPVSYSIGTSISFGPPAQYQKESRFFIYECDEFDRNFLQFKPRQSVIASFDYDHPDTYPTQSDYTYAFQDFVGQSQDTILWQEDADAIGLTDLSSIEILSDTDPGINLIKLPGTHTRKNAWLAVQTVHELFPEHELDTLTDIVASFPGTNRRLEKLAANFYSDYAHHPVEIAATIQAAKEININVVVVYQPHQNIRQHEIMAEGGYKDSFNGAMHIYWLPTYLSREYKELPLHTPTELIASTSNPEVFEAAQMNNALSQKLKDHLANGDLVIGMSAGDLDAWLRKIA